MKKCIVYTLLIAILVFTYKILFGKVKSDDEYYDESSDRCKDNRCDDCNYYIECYGIYE